MNKIELTPSDEIDLVQNYRNLVFEETKSKLTFLIGIYAVRKGILKFKLLKEDTFTIDGQKFHNCLKNVTRKKVMNTLFNTPIKVDEIDYGRLTKETVFKTLYSKHNFNLNDLIALYNNLDVILFKKLTSIEMSKILALYDILWVIEF